MINLESITQFILPLLLSYFAYLYGRKKDEAEIKRLERASKRLKEWAKRSPQSGLAKKGQAMQTRADKVKAEQASVYKEKKRDIKLHHAEISSNALAVVSNTDICTPDGRKLFHIDRFVVKPSDRICILGLNGTGKSMFIQKLIEELQNKNSKLEEKVKEIDNLKAELEAIKKLLTK